MKFQPKNYKRYTYEVTWKKSRPFQQESFMFLEQFALKYKFYTAEKILQAMKVKYRYVFDDDEVIIKRKKFKRIGISGERPHIMNNFFWDVDWANMDWCYSYLYVIERVLARGREQDWEELVRFYGKETVLNVFRNQAISFWPEPVEERARKYFQLQEEDLLVYHHHQQFPDWYSVWGKALAKDVL